MTPPVIAITTSIDDRDARARRHYLHATAAAGALPLLAPPPIAGGSPDPASASPDERRLAARLIATADALILTGGDDPITETFHATTHPDATPVHPERQRWELLLLQLARDTRTPTLGVCLGMQYMALLAGGTLDQSLAANQPLAAPTHAPPPGTPGDTTHTLAIARHDSPLWPATPIPPTPTVNSWHRQAITDPGSLRTLASAPDNIIEAVDDPALPFYAGVQWHPERMPQDNPLGPAIIQCLAAAATVHAP